jgi:hypothetical protein
MNHRSVRKYRTCRGVRDCEVGRPGIKSGSAGNAGNEDAIERDRNAGFGNTNNPHGVRSRRELV